MHSNKENKNNIWLLTKRCTPLSVVTSKVISEEMFESNSIHRMEFTYLNGCLYLIASNLFNSLGLYLINYKKQAQLIHIRTLNIRRSDICWGLVQIPSSPGEFLCGSSGDKNLHVKLVQRNHVVNNEDDQNLIIANTTTKDEENPTDQ